MWHDYVEQIDGESPAEPEWVDGVPFCGAKCPHNRQNPSRCALLGAYSRICEPVVIEMAAALDRNEREEGS